MAQTLASARSRRALASICDTFAPGGDGLPSASELGVPEAIFEAVGRNPRAAERKQFAQLLSLWDTAPLTALAGGGPKRFSSLEQQRREQVLLNWCDSRIGQRRAAFHALRKAALLMYYVLPSPDGSPSPVWESIGYPGPIGPLADAPTPTLDPTSVTADTVVDCDVCVVGSGAGGGTAAGVLAAAGLDVVVLEAGGYYSERDFDGAELQGLQRMYMDGGGSSSADESIALLAGACLGGGTTINFTTSFKTPDDVRAEWAAHGVPAFVSDEYGASLEAVCERLGVNQEHNTPSGRERLMGRGLAELGWHMDSMPRNVRGCDQGENCGYCGYGCRLGAKQSTDKTWLVDAQRAGARIFIDAKADRVVVERGSARGVIAHTSGGHRIEVRSRAVVSACGAIHTPALLRRSGLDNPNIGRNLRLHPATVAWGVFDEPVDPWSGTMQAIYSDERRHLQGNYGVKYETAAVHPSILVVFSPWRSAAEHRVTMESIGHIVPLGVLLRDRDGGSVEVGRDGQPVVHYGLSSFDRRSMSAGLEGGARILEAAGAERIFSSHSQTIEYRPGSEGTREQFMQQANRWGWDAGRCNYASFHIMGSARMGGSPDASACSPRGETWDIRDLYVCDASAFPTASGVNPMISIEAIAHMNASALAQRLK